jgi:hypothetical protein
MTHASDGFRTGRFFDPLGRGAGGPSCGRGAGSPSCGRTGAPSCGRDSASEATRGRQLLQDRAGQAQAPGAGRACRGAGVGPSAAARA